jgi:fructose-specific phosphotransferase system IIA component
LRVADYFKDNLIFLDLEASDKSVAISKMVHRMKLADAIDDEAKFYKEVLEREKLGSTSIGNGVALPHARTENVSEIVVAMARLREGINYDDENTLPVRLIFLLGTPLKAVGEYLKVLARLSKILKENSTRKSLLEADSATRIRQIFSQAED